jgi:hypothetical protein
VKKKVLIVFIILFSLTLACIVEGQETSIILDNNFIGTWQGKNPVPEFSSTSLANCETLIDCPQKNIHCDHEELYLVQTCDMCARCSKASHTITLKLCIVDGQIQGTVQQGGILNKGTIISQTVFAPSNVVLNIQDNKGRLSTLTLKLLEGKKLHGTFSYGLGFNARKLKTSNCG